MDVRADPNLRWDDLVAVERTRIRKSVTVAAIVLPVLIVAGLAAWFLRSHVLPPMVVIPGAMELASVASNPPIAATPPARERPTLPAAHGSRPISETVGAAPTADPAPPDARTAEAPAALPATPLFASLALAPPAASLGRAPAAYAEPGRDVAPEPAIEAGPSLAEPVPLPPRRPLVSVALVSGAVPLPRPRPAQ